MSKAKKLVKRAFKVPSLKQGLLGGLAGDPQGLVLKGNDLKRAADPLGIGDKLKKLSAVPAASELPAVSEMPTPDDAAAMAARRRRQQMSQARSGRQSTMLSVTDTLG